ncbi:MAG: PEGA domain-containing protein [Spirochaetaceae bacterium]
MNVIRPFIAFSIGGNGEGEKSRGARVLGTLLLLLFLTTSGLPAQSLSFAEPGGSIELSVEPEEAEILLDNEPVGNGEVTLTGLKPGSYKVTARLRGYYSETRFLTLNAGEEVELELVLEAVVGFLDVDLSPEDATLLIDDEELDQTPTELPVGTHLLEAKRFGYTPERKRVIVSEGAVTRVSFDLEPAPFEMRELELSRGRFNPANPGEIGTTRVSFRVSSYGEGRFLVRRAGAVVYTEELTPFTTWEQAVLWDGTDMAGEPLPDGEYQFELTAHGRALGSEGRTVSRLAGTLILDRRIRSRFRSLFCGNSGLLYAPLAEPVGPGTTQIATQALAYAEGRENWYVPVVLGGRFGLGVPTALTLTAAPLISSDGGDSRISVSAALEWRYFQLPRRLSLGTVAKGTIASPVGGSYGGRDERTNPTGVSLQHPVTLYLGPIYLTGAPELYFGPDRVSYSEEPAQGGGLWSYLRAGLGYDGAWVSLAVSGAFRSTLLGNAVEWDPPVAVGGEAHFRLPASPLYLSLLLAGDLYPERELLRLKGGVGAGILF